MDNESTDTANDLVRQQSFECAGPIELEVELGAGLAEVRLADDDAGPLAHVEVRPARDGQSGMAAGLTGLLTLVGRWGSSDAEGLPARAVRETTVEMYDNRLAVRAPKSMPLSAVPLEIVVLAPRGSDVTLRAGSADVRIGGTAASCRVQAGSGQVSVEQADGPVQVKAGSGAARLGTIGGDLTAQAGSGDLEIGAVNAGAKVTTGSGDVWIGNVRGPYLQAKTGSGDMTIADVEAGELDLLTGSGNLRVGVHAGVLAELDLVTGSGRARSDLDVSAGPAPGDAESIVRVRGRTGSGNAVVTRATA